MILAELTKLRRSAVWVVAPVLPLLAVITGTVNYDGNRMADGAPERELEPADGRARKGLHPRRGQTGDGANDGQSRPGGVLRRVSSHITCGS